MRSRLSSVAGRDRSRRASANQRGYGRMTTQRVESVEVDDGAFDLHLWAPDVGHGPGLVLAQEIFGVGDYIRAVADRLAALGYVVGAPDLFWRQHRNWQATHDEAGLVGSMELIGQVDPQKAVQDVVASLERLRGLDDVDGSPGIIGFCFGGTMAWAAASEGDPQMAVSYYGSGVPSMLDALDSIRCPVLLHFGDNDPYLPLEGVREVEAAVAQRPDIEVHVHAGAGHAFDNHEAAMFHQPEAAAVAWAQTTAFLHRHLPAR